MFKKIVSLAIALIMIAGMAVIGVSAATEETAEVAADTKFYFEVPSDWNNYKSVFCHIFPYGGDPLAQWQSKKEKCTLVEDRTYSYDPSAKVGGLDASTTYCIIFSLDTGMETYQTLMSTACLGDTLYCNDTKYENPVDSNKTSRAAFWKNHNASEYGPLMQITSIGNLVGTCLAPGETATGLFNKFLTDNLDNARTYSGKTDQAIIDDMASALGLSQDTVETLIKESGITVDWKKAESKAPVVDNPVTNNGGGGNAGNSANSGSIKTGQEMTIVYIAIAMMIASAGVVFFARRKRVTE
ncbi:MAG: LPXTG cell wall anchor domain-containing protein [Ruminococcus sp.]|nr:LPXTG cell wall anchor domain-containing protein [Ruminococcus sp.]